MKKLLSFLIAASMLCSLTCAFVLPSQAEVAGFTGGSDAGADTAAVSTKLGDVDASGKVNATDILQLRLFCAGEDGATPEIDENAADIDASGKVNASDILICRLHVAAALDIEEEYGLLDKRVRVVKIDGVNIRNYTIVLPAETSKTDDNSYYAARELSKYVLQACGAEIPIIIGEFAGDYRINIQYDETDSLGDEGFHITCEDGVLSITGGEKRGCMYGVYEFLESKLGYRFISNTPYLYESVIRDINSGLSDRQVPVLEYRNVDLSFKDDATFTYTLPRKINARETRSNCGADHPIYGRLFGRHFLNAHSFYYYLEGPEGAENSLNWQPCMTDDETYEELFQGLLDTTALAASWSQENVVNPEYHQISFSINDNDKYHKCAYCRAAVAEEGGQAGLIVRFANRATRDIQAYYPGIKIYTAIYSYEAPLKTVPDENLVICYCGNGCNNHLLGTGGCGVNHTTRGYSNKENEAALPKWGELTDNLYFWYYSTNYHYYLSPCPNIMNIRSDFRFAVDCGATGINAENGGGDQLTFERLRAYLESRVLWDPYMTESEFISLMQEYLKLTYGDGWESIYEYILMQDEAGNQAGCFVNNWDRPWEMYSKAYLTENYETMRALLCDAYDKAEGDTQLTLCRRLLLHCDFLGLSATYQTVYKNGSANERAEYQTRYTNLLDYLRTNNLRIFSSRDVYDLPPTDSLSQSPMKSLYEWGSNRNRTLDE